MAKLFVLLALTIVAISVPALAKRPPGSYGAILNSKKEPTSFPSKATGLVNLLYKANAGTVSLTASVKSITDVFMAHIHLGNSTTEGPVVYQIFPTNVAKLEPPITGTFSFKTSFNTSQLILPNTDATNVGAAFQSLLDSEGLYVNFHTLKHPGGEIRGQLHN